MEQILILILLIIVSLSALFIFISIIILSNNNLYNIIYHNTEYKIWKNVIKNINDYELTYSDENVLRYTSTIHDNYIFIDKYDKSASILKDGSVIASSYHKKYSKKAYNLLCDNMLDKIMNNIKNIDYFINKYNIKNRVDANKISQFKKHIQHLTKKDVVNIFKEANTIDITFLCIVFRKAYGRCINLNNDWLDNDYLQAIFVMVLGFEKYYKNNLKTINSSWFVKDRTRLNAFNNIYKQVVK